MILQKKVVTKELSNGGWIERWPSSPLCRFGWSLISYWYAGLRIRIDLMRIRIRILIRHFSNCGSGSSSASRVLWPKTNKYLNLKIFLHFFNQKLQFTYPKLYRRSLQPSKDNIQQFKTWNFFTFYFLWVIFALLDPDPHIECGFGSSNSN
jgi:hypothetical protein